MHNTLIVALTLCIVLVGCSDDRQGFARATFAYDVAAPAQGQYLAREHRVTVDVSEDRIEAAFEATVQACQVDSESTCTVLDSKLTSGEFVTADIRARLKATGIEPLVALAASHGSVETRSTHSEDLAKPILDVEKRLSMLDAYMSDLTRLRQQSKNNVDALIKVTAEIAKTQSDIEALRGEQAQLRQQVDLEILDLHFFSDRSQSHAAPIRKAIRDFSRDLTSGIAQAITGLAHLLPWLVILLPLVFLFGFLWRKFR